MPRPRILLAALVCGGLASYSGSPLAAVVLPFGFINEVLVTGLDQPTSMAFLPDGRLLLTEQRTGRVRLVVNGHLASSDPVLVVPGVNFAGLERGLEGIAVDPRWPARPYVYLYYTRNGNQCWLVRYRAAGSLTDPLGETLSLESPLTLIDDIPDNDPNHNSGCLRFAPDGKLFVSVGEDEDVCAAPDLTQLKGKLLRLDVMRLGDGEGGPVPRDSITPGDNPFDTTDSNARLVWAYGMRNPWRFQIDPVTSNVYCADVGEDKVEEVNEVRAGYDLGWPWREGNVIVPRANCPEPEGEGAHPYVHPIVAMPRGPEFTAIICGGMYRKVVGASANWPGSYVADVFYGEYYSGVLRRIRKTGSEWHYASPVFAQPDDSTWATGLISQVDYMVGPDGSLWWLRQFDESNVTGSLQRIRYIIPLVDTGPATNRELSLAGRPNPFSEHLDLSFRMAAPGYVRLELFDMAGRMVRRLLDASVPAGEHLEPWNGRDASNRSVPPGVYLVRLETPQGVEARRVLRIR